jgi:HSP20 family protein
MSNSDNSKRQPEISAGMSLGGLFKGLGDLVELLGGLADSVERAGGAIERSGELNAGGRGDRARVVYGVSIRSGVGGAPQVERFGNLRPTKAGAEVSPVREPLVDVFDEDAELLIVAELPGVAEEDLRVELHGDVLAIETAGERRFAKELLLPVAVAPASLRTMYRNGILELRLTKV